MIHAPSGQITSISRGNVGILRIKSPPYHSDMWSFGIEDVSLPNARLGFGDTLLSTKNVFGICLAFHRNNAILSELKPSC
jgi:hypothetical protein